MKTWMIVLLVLAVIYVLGAVGCGLYWRSFKMALIWPLWVLFGLFGNIQ